MRIEKLSLRVMFEVDFDLDLTWNFELELRYDTRTLLSSLEEQIK